jgi:hypothetical protein
MKRSWKVHRPLERTIEARGALGRNRTWDDL